MLSLTTLYILVCDLLRCFVGNGGVCLYRQPKKFFVLLGLPAEGQQGQDGDEKLRPGERQARLVRVRRPRQQDLPLPD